MYIIPINIKNRIYQAGRTRSSNSSLSNAYNAYNCLKRIPSLKPSVREGIMRIVSLYK